MKRFQFLLISSIMLCAPACACPPSVAPHVNVDVQLSGDKTDDTNATTTTSSDVSEPDLGGTPTTGNISEPGAKITGNVSMPNSDGKATGINITVKSPPNFPTSPTASPPK